MYIHSIRRNLNLALEYVTPVVNVVIVSNLEVSGSSHIQMWHRRLLVESLCAMQPKYTLR